MVLEYQEFQVDFHHMADDVEGPGKRAGLLAAGIYTQTQWKNAIARFPVHGKIPHTGLVDTGTYLRSIQVESFPDHVEVGTDIVDPPYPFYLEFGTSRMPAYAHVRPMLDREEAKILAEAEEVEADIIERWSN